MSYHDERAEALRKAAYALGDLLAGKAAAYGNAQDMQRGLWRVLLEPYRKDGHYVLPVAAMDHLPRLTRIFDRVCRIVANPEGDRQGEDPWRDLAGDAIAGHVMPRSCPEVDCEMPAGHQGPHRAFDSRGVTRWVGGDGWSVDWSVALCGAEWEGRICTLREGHVEGHMSMDGVSWLP